MRRQFLRLALYLRRKRDRVGGEERRREEEGEGSGMGSGMEGGMD